MEVPRMSWQLYVVAAMTVVYSALLHWVAIWCEVKRDCPPAFFLCDSFYACPLHGSPTTGGSCDLVSHVSRLRIMPDTMFRAVSSPVEQSGSGLSVRPTCPI